METGNSYFAAGVDMIERSLWPIHFSSICSYMPILLDLACGRSDIEGRESDKRGYLTLMNGGTGKIIFTIPFGDIPEEKREKYFHLSQEQAIRLFSQVNMHLTDGHTTSFQSRNEAAGQYGGAIYVQYHTPYGPPTLSLIFSFSGMPAELIDEAMMMALSKRLVDETPIEILMLPEAEKRNTYWMPLYNDFWYKTVKRI